MERELGDQLRIAERSPQGQTFREQRRGLCVAALGLRHHAEIDQQVGHAVRVAELPEARKAVLEQVLGGSIVALNKGKIAGHAPHHRMDGWIQGGTFGRRQHGPQPAPSLADIAAREPEPFQRPAEPPGDIQAARVQGPGQGRAEVVVLALHACLPGSARIEVVEYFGQRHEIGGMPATQHVLFTAGSQLRPRKLAHRLQQPIAPLSVEVFLQHQRCGDQVLQGEAEISRRSAGAHGLRGVQRPAAGEDRDPGQQLLFSRRKQAVAPDERTVHRLMAWDGRAIRVGQQRHLILQLGGNLAQRQAAGERRG